MLLCLTKIDDIPEVEANLKNLAMKMNWEFKFVNAPIEKELLLYSNDTKVIFMNPNKSHVYFNKNVLEKFKKLDVLCTASTGTVHIDLKAANYLGITVINIKNYTEILKTVPSTAELAFALTLNGLRKIIQSHNDALQHKSWDFEKYIGKQIKDLKIGVIGYGRLGSIYSKMMNDSGAKISILDPLFALDFEKAIQNFLKEASTFDVLSIHIHAEKNINFVDKKFFEVIPDDIIIVNTSRGEVINHNDLFNFLQKNPKAQYCTDVLPEESNNFKRKEMLKKFSKYPNILVTQHIGGMSLGARKTAFGLASNLLLEHYGIFND